MNDLALALREAILTAGGLRSLARKIGTSHQAVAQWDRIPAERVADVERATGIARQTLRPDLFETVPDRPKVVMTDDERLREAVRRAAARAVHGLLMRDPDILSARDATTMARRLAAFFRDELIH